MRNPDSSGGPGRSELRSILKDWSRRDFLKRSAGFAALAGIGSWIVEACTPAAAPPSAQPSLQAVKGGNYVEGDDSATSVGFNPLLASPFKNTLAMFDGLLGFLPDGSLIPLLAQSLPKISADGLTYTFALRKDVKWTDGTPLTADDVVFTYRLLYHPDYKAFPTAFRADLEALIADVRAPDSATVVIQTKTTSAPFLAAHSRYGVLPKHVLGNVPAADLKGHPFNTSPTVTSGPFKFKDFVSGDHATVVRNEGSYRGVPNLDSYTIRLFALQASIVEAVKAQNIDAMTVFAFPRYDELKADPNLNVKFVPTGVGAPRFVYNLDPAAAASKIFSSKAVRQALLYAADREGAAKATLFGYGSTPSSTGVFWPGNWANNPDAKPQYAYDKAMAENLLDADGWKKGTSGIREKNGAPLKFELITAATNQTYVDISTIFAQNWKSIGVDVTIRPLQYAQLITAALAHEFDMVTVSQPYALVADPDPSSAFHSRNAVKNIGQNWGSYKNPALDQLLDQAAASFDQAARKDIYFKVQDILNEDVPVWSTSFWQIAWTTNKRVKFAGPDRFGLYTYNVFGTYMNECYVADGK